MKKLMIFSSVLILFLTLAGGAGAALVNGGFETGNLSGWTTFLNGGSASVVTSTTADGNLYNPVEGSYFAILKAGAANTGQTISQSTIFLNVGDKLSGYAAFDGGDYLPFNDSAFATVNGTTVWSANISSVGNYGNTPWQYWEYIATLAGNYTLTLGVANALDSGLSSRAFFDANCLTTSAVPLPGAVWLLGSSLLGLLAYRRIKG